MNNKPFFYLYKAKIIRILDGDSVVAELNCGLDIKVTKKMRLYGINAPEMRGPEKLKGQTSKRHLQDLLGAQWTDSESTVRGYVLPTVIETIKDKKGKYGRYLANIWVEQVDLQDFNPFVNYDVLKNCNTTHIDGKLMICINDIMVVQGQAKYKEY